MLHSATLNPGLVARVKDPSWKNYNTCRLLISVGKPYHEGEQLDAALDWVNQNFKGCIISLGDVLQRHNYMTESFSIEKAYAIAKNAGNEWLERNREKLERLKIPYEIIRWEQLLNHSTFPKNLEKVQQVYASNLTFRKAILDDINRFITSRKKFSPVSKEIEKDMIENGVLFLLEETAGVSILLEQTEAVDLYPGSELKAIGIFRNGDFPPVLPSLKKRTFVRLGFVPREY